ncbi:MAG: ribonuclease PH [Actinomycetota bacterium]|nr:ribonuclease PH [Actinomycetota bacterium]
MSRRTERPQDGLRPVHIRRGYTDMTPGSVLFEMGRTRVLCTASLETELPRWLRGQGKGWVTAEYAMLPGSSSQRITRDSYRGGRAKEIQRLIGRSLRSVVDLERVGEMVLRVDCDVLQADGGTRTAAVTGAWVAVHDALQAAVQEGRTDASALLDQCAAVSVGLVDGIPLLDLDYAEDVEAQVDMNVVMSGSGRLVEVQGTAEGSTFSRQQLMEMLELAEGGIKELVAAQREAVAA